MEPMKGLGGTSPFHRFTNPRRDKSVYVWTWGSLFTKYSLKIAKTREKWLLVSLN